MPLYHFNTYDRNASPDRKGVEIETLADAKQEAMRFLGAALQDRTIDLRNGKDWRLEVADHSGLLLFTVTVSMEDALVLRQL